MKNLLLLILLSITCLKAQQHPDDISIDVASIKPGQMELVAWDGKPVIVYKRTMKEINALKQYSRDKYLPQTYALFMESMKFASRFANYVANYYMMDQRDLDTIPLRSKRDDIFVAIGYDTGTGIMLHKTEQHTFQAAKFEHKQYDLAGRHFISEKSKAYNLFIPPYYYKGDKLIIGVQNRLNEFKEYDFDDIPYSKLTLNERLFFASLNCKLDIVKESLQNGANPNVKFNGGNTAITMAVVTRCKKKVELINTLAKYKPDFNACNNMNNSALDIAIHSDFEVIKALVDNGADVNFNCNPQGFKSEVFVINLVSNYKKDTLFYLINHDLDLDQKYQEGQTIIDAVEDTYTRGLLDKTIYTEIISRYNKNKK